MIVLTVGNCGGSEDIVAWAATSAVAVGVTAGPGLHTTRNMEIRTVKRVVTALRNFIIIASQTIPKRKEKRKKYEEMLLINRFLFFFI